MIQKNTNPTRLGRPPKSGFTPEETRIRLIRCGIEVFTKKGFNSAGLDEILRHEKVPKGSFYHYFRNKEAFGEAVITEYAQYFANKLDRNFSNDQLPPMQRLQSFVDEACHGMQKHHFQRGCLIGNLGQELGSLPPAFRQQLDSVFVSWQSHLSALLQLAKERGELPVETDTEALSAFFWIGWEGAILKAKLEQSDQPMHLFTDYFMRLCR